MVSRQLWIAFLLATTSTKYHESAKQTKKERTRFIFTCPNLFYCKHVECWICWVHWLLLLLLYDQKQQQQSNCRETECFFFCVWDPLGQPLERYQLFSDHLVKVSEKNRKIKKFATLDYQSSLHIQTLVVSLAPISHITWFKKLNKNLYVTATSIVSFCLFFNH